MDGTGKAKLPGQLGTALAYAAPSLESVMLVTLAPLGHAGPANLLVALFLDKEFDLGSCDLSNPVNLSRNEMSRRQGLQHPHLSLPMPWQTMQAKCEDRARMPPRTESPHRLFSVFLGH